MERGVHMPVSLHRGRHQVSQSLQTAGYQEPCPLLPAGKRNPCPRVQLCRVRCHRARSACLRLTVEEPQGHRPCPAPCSPRLSQGPAVHLCLSATCHSGRACDALEAQRAYGTCPRSHSTTQGLSPHLPSLYAKQTECGGRADSGVCDPVQSSTAAAMGEPGPHCGTELFIRKRERQK